MSTQTKPDDVTYAQTLDLVSEARDLDVELLALLSHRLVREGRVVADDTRVGQHRAQDGVATCSERRCVTNQSPILGTVSKEALTLVGTV